MPDLSGEQLRNAAIIYEVGRGLGASVRDIQIALITAWTESRLVNVNYGDRDSLGLFQQRAAWAPASKRMDPYQSARMFFLGGQQGQRGLFDFKNRESMGMGEAAQAVQVSAFPDRYIEGLPLIRSNFHRVAKRAGVDVRDIDGKPIETPDPEPEPLDAPVRDTLDAPSYGGVLGAQTSDALGAQTSDMLGAPTQDGLGAVADSGLGEKNPLTTPLSEETNKALKDIIGQNSVAPGKGVSGIRAAVVDMAKEYIGTPYVWGGAGPSGFDCSGIIQYVYGKLGVELPRVSYQQANSGKRVGLNKLKPGDLVAWDNSGRNPGADHIAIYVGGGQILEAPQPGQSVRIRNLGENEGAWGVKLDL